MFADHDAYIAEAPRELRPLLVRMRAQLARALPDAEEVIAYKMPGFRIGKSIVAGYAASASNVGSTLSRRPIGPHARAALADSPGPTAIHVLILPGPAGRSQDRLPAVNAADYAAKA